MADAPRAKDKVVKDTQPEAMPTSNQQTPEQEGATPAGETITEPASSEEGQELPEGVKERTTEQFDKLKKELAAERERRVRLERQFAPPSQTLPQIPEWYDPTTGLVDVSKLSQREAILRQELNQVKSQLVGVARQSEITQEKEAYAAYPELNPNRNNFDENFQEHVISYMATAFTKGQTPTLKEAADKVMSLAKKVATKAEAEGAQKALEQLSPKEQASLEATGRSDRRLPRVDWEQIRVTTRRGGHAGLEAAMQRISRIKSVGS